MEGMPYTKLLITGGCGYVGQRLAHHLREACPGMEIVLFDIVGELML